VIGVGFWLIFSKGTIPMFRKLAKSPINIKLECQHTGTINNEKRLLNININNHVANIHTLKQLQKEYDAIKQKYDEANKHANLTHHFCVSISGQIHGHQTSLNLTSLDALQSFVAEQVAKNQSEKDAKPELRFFSPM
jgi:hypothetical protein